MEDPGCCQPFVLVLEIIGSHLFPHAVEQFALAKEMFWETILVVWKKNPRCFGETSENENKFLTISRRKNELEIGQTRVLFSPRRKHRTGHQELRTKWDQCLRTAEDLRHRLLVFRPSATVSRIGLMESRVHHHCHGGPPPLCLLTPPWLATPLQLHIMMQAALWSHV